MPKDVECNIFGFTTEENTDQHGPRDVTFTIREDERVVTRGDPHETTVSVLDDDTPPTAIRSPGASPRDERVQLRWTAPEAGGGGQPVTAYEVRWRPRSGGAWSAWTRTGDAAERHYTATGLTNDVEYEFEIRAVNGAGLAGPATTVYETPVESPFLVEPTWETDEGGSLRITISPPEAPYATNKTLTMVVASDTTPGVTPGPMKKSDYIIRREGDTPTQSWPQIQPGSYDLSALPGKRHLGTQPAFDIRLPGGHTEVVVTFESVDDDEAEFQEVAFLYLIIDGTWQNPRESGSDGVSIAANDRWVEPRDADVGEVQAVIEMSRPVKLVEPPPSDDGTPGQRITDYFLLFTGDAPPTWGDGSQGAKYVPTPAPGQPAGVRPSGVSTSAKFVTVQFPDGIPANTGAWLVYDANNINAPLHDARPANARPTPRQVPRFIIQARAPSGRTVSIGNASAHEDDGTMDFTVRLSHPATDTVRVDYETDERPATGGQGSATPGADYETVTGTVEFAAGETTATITVPIVDDPYEDPNEAFLVRLSNPVGARIHDGEAVGTIHNTEKIAIASLTLVDTASATDEGTIGEGAAFTLDDPATGSWTVRANPAADAAIGSIAFTLAGAASATRTVNEAPWTLHASGGASLPAGSYTLTAVAYQNDDAGGETLQTLTVSFTVAAATDTEAPETPTALTATFRNVPDAHRGAGTTFTFEVLFSEAIRVSYRVLRDDGAFTVTNGTVRKARRVDGRHDLREIHVEPTGWDPVTVTLPATTDCAADGAICHDGRKLSNTQTATVAGPAALDIADAEATEGTDPALVFNVTLTKAMTETVTVAYATSDGSATAPADYADISGTLTFTAGVTAKTITVPIVNDAHDDDGETMTVTLSGATGPAKIRTATATGTIHNADPIPKGWNLRFGRAAAEHVGDAIGRRVDALGTAGASHVQLAGQPLPLAGGEHPGETAGGETEDRLAALARGLEDLAGDDGERWGDTRAAPGGERTLSAEEVLLGSRFLLRLGTSDDESGAAPGGWTAWGGAAASRFEGIDEGVAMDGEVTTVTLGADTARGPWLAGAALALSRGDGTYRTETDGDNEGSGALKATLTSLHPYAALTLNERVRVWGAAGFGAGTLELDVNDGGQWRSDTTQTMAGAGARGVLVAPAGPGGVEIAARTDAMWQRMTSEKATNADGETLAATRGHTHRLRLVLEGSARVQSAGGSQIAPTVELGLRHDGGDAETGAGVELGGGVRYASPGGRLGGEVRARTLLAHAETGVEEWGASGTVTLAPHAGGRGLGVTIASAFGVDGSANGLWEHRDARGFARNGAAEAGRETARLDAEVGYGFTGVAGRGVATPYARWSRSGETTTRTLGQRLERGRSRWDLALEDADEARSWRGTYTYGLAGGGTLALEAARREGESGPETTLTVRAGVRW